MDQMDHAPEHETAPKVPVAHRPDTPWLPALDGETCSRPIAPLTDSWIRCGRPADWALELVIARVLTRIPVCDRCRSISPLRR